MSSFLWKISKNLMFSSIVVPAGFLVYPFFSDYKNEIPLFKFSYKSLLKSNAPGKNTVNKQSESTVALCRNDSISNFGYNPVGQQKN